MITYPEIDFFEKPCTLTNDALRYFTDIKNVWSGFRTCYTDHVDFSETLVDKAKLPALCELYSKDSEKSEAKLETLSKKYGYSFDSELAPAFHSLQFSFSYYENLLDSEDPVEHFYAQSWFQYLNALKFIAPKVKMGHESPLEHSILTFKIKNCSRSMTHQLVRHRLASYSQASQRYISEKPESLDFVIPRKIQENPEALAMVQKHFSGLGMLITGLKALGVKNEDIRCIYPNAMPTDIQVSMNFRELRHFIQLRLSPHAQDEIRFVAFRIYQHLVNYMPFLWTDLELEGV